MTVRLLVMKRLLLPFLLLSTNLWADSYQGTGKNFGEGWQRDSQGNLHGTGKNFGEGWAPDGNGGYRGTGKNFGKNWLRWARRSPGFRRELRRGVAA
jgi:hypothetical protein